MMQKDSQMVIFQVTRRVSAALEVHQAKGIAIQIA
jgi:hypothetical protein